MAEEKPERAATANEAPQQLISYVWTEEPADSIGDPQELARLVGWEPEKEFPGMSEPWLCRHSACGNTKFIQLENRNTHKCVHCDREIAREREAEKETEKEAARASKKEKQRKKIEDRENKKAQRERLRIATAEARLREAGYVAVGAYVNSKSLQEVQCALCGTVGKVRPSQLSRHVPRWDRCRRQ